MKKLSKMLAILVAAFMLVAAFAGCQTKPTEPTEPAAPATEATAAPEATEAPVVYEDQPFGENLPTAPTVDTPLVVAYSPFSQKFSPFYADTGYDQDVVTMTQVQVLTTDRMGGIINNAIEGETRSYNGTDYFYKGPADTSVVYDAASDTTTYTAKLRVGMKFSDGKPVTADDLIFTYYTYLDPSYVGSTTLSSYKIIGLQNYRTQTTDEVYEKYSKLVKDYFAAGADAAADDLGKAYWTLLDNAWKADVQSIVDYCDVNYIDSYAGSKYIPNWTAEEVRANEGLRVATGMAMWGFGSYNDAGEFVAKGTEATFNMTDAFPTIDDYFASVKAAYATVDDYEAAGESPNGVAIHANADAAFIAEYGSKDEAMGGAGVPSIAGITKIDDYIVQVVTEGFEAPAVYSILGLQIVPLHYYGDESKYDYENNKFGFDFGDLSKQESLTTTPVGAGPYKFVKYENKVVYFEANENYYRGCPKIREIQFKETASAEVATALQTGTADAGELTGSRKRFEEVAGYNSNGDITGNIITTSKVDNLGYGYLGCNADTVCIGGEPASDASKALRTAMMTIFAVYRDVAIDSYYGEAASVINYPISNTSWAAPQPTDEDYHPAFSLNAEGAEIYTAEMAMEEKYAAAAASALSWFAKAGYTVENGKVTAAPEGGRMSFEVIIPGDGTGDHPAFAILTGAQAAFEAIGIELKINDPADSNVLWDALDAGTQDFWTAAWGATIDPDMYQVYHSSGVVGEGGSDSNHYHIRDAELDQLILDARKSDDQNYRKAVYKQCLDIIIDWAVELPTYQRQNCIVFSTERIKIDTLTPDITTFWGWLNDIELIEMN